MAALSLVQSTLRPLQGSSFGDPVGGRSYVGPDGVLTFVLYVAFLMDDFVCRVGRRASAGGVYLIYLSCTATAFAGML